MSAAPELKATLTLPKTAFPMKANLPQSEPERLRKWAAMDIYASIRASRAGRPRYILHDGPPYANGPIHLGHALNKCLKDFVVKAKTMAGLDAPYVPGWDCHGLPIEIKVDEKLGRRKLEMPALSVRRACREYAQKYVDLQSSQFQRIGVFGRFERPYSTMDFAYEADILEAFYSFYENGFVYKGLKPVYWCIHDRTALAEAEVEYEQHTSPSIYVRYALRDDAAAIDPALAGREVYAIIWTTTPWTLPASLAIAFHPGFEYVALEDRSRAARPVYLVAAELADSVRQACGLAGAAEIARFPGSRLERVLFRHPFLDRDILGVNAEYVTADTGTGAVHTAPAHGADDFYTGVRYGLSQECRVDDAGRIHAGPADRIDGQVPVYDGRRVFEANPLIVELLGGRGALMGSGAIEHSYPHCWRCHRPVIFRATEQWFIGMETPMPAAGEVHRTLRERALEEITRVHWDPAWGEERIANMIATRPDWCISRQRIWGVPIAVFLCQACSEPLNQPAVHRRVVERFRQQGADAWYGEEAGSLLPADTVCARCGGSGFRREMDILDVWFESGSSWHAVLEADPGLGWPADLYLEGGDQHRGWFHSSLLCSVGIRGRAPYRGVATAGWTLDEQGRAMSKSLGNGVDPVEVAERLGGEIVRLWVASVDFREDMAASENLMQRVAENYRKVRNTFRFLLGNLHGFDPATDALPFDELLPLDRYLLARTRELTEKILRWYDEFEFHRVYHAVNEFTAADLSALYLDALKDRMYTLAARSPERRSAQTVLHAVCAALVRLVAPILSFTAEEVWEYMPAAAGREASVHLSRFPDPESLYPGDPGAYLADWARLLAIREEALRALEEARRGKRIGKALEAAVRLRAAGADLELLERYRDSLKELLNVSQVYLEPGPALEAEALPAAGARCERCWNYMPDLADYGAWANVCGRCRGALREMGIEPPPVAAGVGR